MEVILERERAKLIQQLEELPDGAPNDELILKININDLKIKINNYEIQLNKAIAEGNVPMVQEINKTLAGTRGELHRIQLSVDVQISHESIQTPYKKFHSMVVSAGYTIDEETEDMIKTKYPYRLLIIENVDDALKLFQDACNLPRKTTEIRLQENHHLLLAGDEFQQSRASLLIRAFSTITGEAKIVKFTQDASNEFEMFQQTGLTPQQSLDCRLVPLETLVADLHGKRAVVMPMLYCTIDLLKFPEKNKPENLLWKGFQDIMIAVNRLHEAGIVHNDIKPANILVGAGGHWYLCDYGSCSRVGNRTSQTQMRYTPMYIPRDFKERRTERFDYLLLIVTILDRFTDGDFTRSDFTLRDVHDGIPKFAHVELTDNLMALWNRYFQ